MFNVNSCNSLAKMINLLMSHNKTNDCECNDLCNENTIGPDDICYFVCDRHKESFTKMYNDIYDKYPELHLKHLMRSDSRSPVKNLSLYRDDIEKTKKLVLLKKTEELKES